MIKHINLRQVQNGVKPKIAVKTFPGATISDMSHYAKPGTDFLGGCGGVRTPPEYLLTPQSGFAPPQKFFPPPPPQRYY